MADGTFPSFYDPKWTVLEKLKYLEQFFNINTLDLSTIAFSEEEYEDGGVNYIKVVISGKNYKGENITLPQLNLIKPTQGEKGEQGEQGVGIESVTVESYVDEGETTKVTLKFTKTDGTYSNVVFDVKNGADGEKGETGAKGATGKGLASVTVQSVTQQDDYTATKLLFTYTDNTTTVIPVLAKDGVAGSRLSTISTGASVQEEGFTVTPLLLVDDQGGSWTVRIPAKNGVDATSEKVTITNVEGDTVTNVTQDTDAFVIEGSCSVTYSDNSVQSATYSYRLPIKAGDGIVFDIAENNLGLELHIDGDITSKLAKCLVIPTNTPTSISFVAVDTTKAQTMIELGEGLAVENGKLKVTVSGGANPLNATSDNEMNALLVADNVGKVAQFNGTSETYVNGGYYLIVSNSKEITFNVYISSSFRASLEFYFNDDMVFIDRDVDNGELYVLHTIIKKANAPFTFSFFSAENIISTARYTIDGSIPYNQGEGTDFTDGNSSHYTQEVSIQPAGDMTINIVLSGYLD